MWINKGSCAGLYSFPNIFSPVDVPKSAFCGLSQLVSAHPQPQDHVNLSYLCTVTPRSLVFCCRRTVTNNKYVYKYKNNFLWHSVSGPMWASFLALTGQLGRPPQTSIPNSTVQKFKLALCRATSGSYNACIMRVFQTHLSLNSEILIGYICSSRETSHSLRYYHSGSNLQ